MGKRPEWPTLPDVQLPARFAGAVLLGELPATTDPPAFVLPNKPPEIQITTNEEPWERKSDVMRYIPPSEEGER